MSENFELVMASMTDKELVNIVFVEPQNFGENALTAAKSILSNRNLSESDIQALIEVIGMDSLRKAEEDKKMNKFLKFFNPWIYFIKKKSDKMKMVKQD